MSDVSDINQKLTDEMQVSLSKNQYLTFLIDGESFAMPVIKIREIIEYDQKQVTVVPTSLSIFRGVINLRGKIVPVIDLSRKFSLKESPVTARTCIIVMDMQMDDEAVTIGSMVDKVLLVQDINEDQIDIAPELGTVIESKYIKGIGKIDGQFITILNVDQIFTQNEVIFSTALLSGNGAHHENGQVQS